MNLVPKIVLYALLALGLAFFGQRFVRSISRTVDRGGLIERGVPGVLDSAATATPGEAGTATPANPGDASEPATNRAGMVTNGPSAGRGGTNLALGIKGAAPRSAVPDRASSLGWSAAMAFGCVLGLALMVGLDVSHYFANRAHHSLYNEEGEGIHDPEYDRAEQVWADGDHLEAIRLMREYLQANPRELHVALRIAEIYEKDLNSPLAAALEYEEVLKHKFDSERWGWAAIHLCNLYARLEKPAQMEGLMREIIRRAPATGAAKKAREKLGLPEDAVIVAASPPEVSRETDPPPDPGPKLPPGFKPRKG